MKTSIFSLVVVGMLTGCQPQVEVKNGSVNDLSDFAQKYLQLNGAASRVFTSTQNSAMGRTTISKSHPSGRSASSRCGIDTLIHNPDGSALEIIDYGDSCVQDYGLSKVVYWGRSTTRYKYTNSKEGSAYVGSYFGNSQFKNFGGRYVSKDLTYKWNANGNYSYSGISRNDTLQQAYSGSSESSDSSAFTYNDQSYLHLESARNTFDDKRSVQVIDDNQYVYGGNSYHSIVTVPVVRDYTCSPFSNVPSNSDSNGLMPATIANVVVPISGHEVVNYNQNGKSGTFEIDYGNGECDTLVTIIEDGKSVIVDLARINPTTSGG